MILTRSDDRTLTAETNPATSREQQLRQREELLRQRVQRLRRRLKFSQTQLRQVSDVAAQIAALREPRLVQEVLLQRIGRLLGADALYLVFGSVCVRAAGAGGMAACAAASGEAVPAPLLLNLLRDELQTVRQTNRALPAALCLNTPAPSRGERGTGDSTRLKTISKPGTAVSAQGAATTHVALLARWPQIDTEPGVLIALRTPAAGAFTPEEQRAAETILTHGGIVLRNLRMASRLSEYERETITALTQALDAKDACTAGHSGRVGWLATLLGRALGMAGAELRVLSWAGRLHDVGKLGVPEQILNKPGRLTPDEFEQIRRHPRLSYEVLAPVTSLKPLLHAVLHHHENHDGSGYPAGLAGEQIPLGARVLRVVDTFDALVSDRPYRAGLRVEEALQTLASEAGRATDPLITATFISEFRRYMTEQADDFAQRFGRRGPSSRLPDGNANEIPGGIQEPEERPTISIIRGRHDDFDNQKAT